MAKDASFDIVSKVDRQEVDNALNQANKEIQQRFDFKGTETSLAWSGTDVMVITSSTDDRALAAWDVLQTKLVKRGVSLKAITATDPTTSGKLSRIEATVTEGLSSENAKKISKLIRDDGPKGIKTQIQGEELRVTGKSRDDLQAVVQLVKSADFDFAVQCLNYR